MLSSTFESMTRPKTEEQMQDAQARNQSQIDKEKNNFSEHEEISEC